MSRAPFPPFPKVSFVVSALAATLVGGETNESPALAHDESKPFAIRYFDPEVLYACSESEQENTEVLEVNEAEVAGVKTESAPDHGKRFSVNRSYASVPF